MAPCKPLKLRSQGRLSKLLIFGTEGASCHRPRLPRMLLKSVTMGITAMHTYDKCSISKKITGRTIAMLPATSAVTFGFDVLVGNCWTIDATSHASGGADNGFLDCARSHTPGYRSDSTTAQAVNNLVACIGAGTGVANIVGHGNDGLIVTGQGQAPSDPQRFITTWNENIWGPLCRALRGKGLCLCFR